jgi:hypothetical protein
MKKPQSALFPNRRAQGRRWVGGGGAWRVGEDREEREREIDRKWINLRERRSKTNRSGV